MEFFKDLWGFSVKRRNAWIAAMVMFILLVAGLIYLSSSSTAASFIYAIF